MPRSSPMRTEEKENLIKSGNHTKNAEHANTENQNPIKSGNLVRVENVNRVWGDLPIKSEDKHPKNFINKFKKIFINK